MLTHWRKWNTPNKVSVVSECRVRLEEIIQATVGVRVQMRRASSKTVKMIGRYSVLTCGTRKRFSEILIPHQKLQMKCESPTIPVEDIEKNEVARDTSIATQLLIDMDKTQIHLVADVTGSGKSHTTFAKSREFQKRVLGVMPHTELAQQAVALAHKIGFFSPFHLKSRDVNWDDSEIAAIPIENREANLFDHNPCIMVDKIQEYTEKTDCWTYIL